jgi:hypothetical protein
MEIDDCYRKVAAEQLACVIASRYFESLISPERPQINNQLYGGYGRAKTEAKAAAAAQSRVSFFEPKYIDLEDIKAIKYPLDSIETLQPYLNCYGLRATDHIASGHRGDGFGQIRVGLL